MRIALVLLFLIASPVFAFGGSELIQVSQEYPQSNEIALTGFLLLLMSFCCAIVCLMVASIRERAR